MMAHSSSLPTTEVQFVELSSALRALPRAQAPARLNRGLRRELTRVRRRRAERHDARMWTAAAAIQVALLAALCALYVLAAPADASPAKSSEASSSRRAITSAPTDASRQSQPKRGPTTP